MRLAALLFNIRSVHNVGSIFRTADAASLEKIYLCGITPTPNDRFGRMRSDFAKVALGAEVPWEHIESAARAITKLKKEGWKIVAVEQAENAKSYTKIAKEIGYAEKICIVMGNEVEGLPNALLKRVDFVAEIPMRGVTTQDKAHPKKTGRGKESLNVSVAFGIIAFAFRLGA